MHLVIAYLMCEAGQTSPFSEIYYVAALSGVRFYQSLNTQGAVKMLLLLHYMYVPQMPTDADKATI